MGFFVGDFFGDILLAILKNEKYGDFFGYFSRNLGEILGESSGHTGCCKGRNLKSQVEGGCDKRMKGA